MIGTDLTKLKMIHYDVHNIKEYALLQEKLKNVPINLKPFKGLVSRGIFDFNVLDITASLKTPDTKGDLLIDFIMSSEELDEIVCKLIFPISYLNINTESFIDAFPKKYKLFELIIPVEGKNVKIYENKNSIAITYPSEKKKGRNLNYLEMYLK